MSTLLNFIETNKKKGLLFWLNYLITNLNIYKEIPVDNSWKGLKLQSSYYPPFFPKNNLNNINLYLELQWQDKLIKRK